MSKAPVDFFTKEMAKGYDERNRKLSAISDNLHFLTALTLESLPTRANVLSVGAGTGAEILALAKIYPEWNFMAVEPSLAMLEICRERVAAAGFSERCEFVHGTAEKVAEEKKFDAVLSVLVAHFIPRDSRAQFYRDLAVRLKKGGILVNAEISFDLDSPEFPQMLDGWKSVQRLMGGTPESLEAVPKMLRENLTVLPPKEVAQLIQEAGIAKPVSFFQSFMINAWFGRKS